MKSKIILFCILIIALNANALVDAQLISTPSLISQKDGNYSIQFDVNDTNDSIASLSASIYYGASENSTSSTIKADLNLLSTSNCTNADSNISTSQNLCTYDWNSIGVNGRYYITVVITNSSALTKTISNSNYFTIDNSSPSISISSPTSNLDTNAKRLDLNFSATDIGGIDSSTYIVKLYKGSDLNQTINYSSLTISNITDGNTVGYAFAGLTDSNYAITIDVNDIKDHNSWTQINFEIDTNAPSTINDLNAHDVNGTEHIDLNWTSSIELGSGISYYEIYRKDSNFTSLSQATTIITTTNNYYRDVNVGSAVTYYYAITAVDKAGNRALISNVDSGTSNDANGPICSITSNDVNGFVKVKQPPFNFSCNETPIKMKIACSDSNWNISEIDYVSQYIYFDITYSNTCSSSDGNKTLYFKFEDSLGNWSASKLKWLYYDTTVPNTPTDLKSKATLKRVDLNWSIPSDSGSGIKGFRLFRKKDSAPTINDGYLYLPRSQDENTFSTSTFEWSEIINETGTYYYSINAIDYLDNESALSDAVSITVNVSGPIFEISLEGNKIDSKYYVKSGTIKVTAKSNNSITGLPIIKVKLQNDDWKLLTVSGSNKDFSSSFIVTEGHDGSAEIVIEATDTQNNFNSTSMTFEVDTQKPLVTDFTAQDNNYSAAISVKSNQDMYKALFYFRNKDLNEQNFTLIGENNVAKENIISIDWNLTSKFNDKYLINGKYELKIIIEDKAGNQDIKLIDYTINIENIELIALQGLIQEVNLLKDKAIEKENAFKKLSIKVPEIISNSIDQGNAALKNAIQNASANNLTGAREFALQATKYYSKAISSYEIETYEMHQGTLDQNKISATEIQTKTGLIKELAEKALTTTKTNLFERNLKIIKINQNDSNASESFNAVIEIRFKNDSNNTLNNVEIIELIPKDFANNSDLLSLPLNAIVLNKDPLIKFTFSEIKPGAEVILNYSLANALSKQDLNTLIESKILEKFELQPIALNNADTNPIDFGIQEQLNLDFIPLVIIAILIIAIASGIVLFLKKRKKSFESEIDFIAQEKPKKSKAIKIKFDNKPNKKHDDEDSWF